MTPVPVYPARLKLVKQGGVPVRIKSERGGEPTIVLQWLVHCGHPSCRRVFGRLQLTASRLSPSRLLLDPQFVQKKDEPGVWCLGNKVARTHSRRSRRPRLLAERVPELKLELVPLAGAWFAREVPREDHSLSFMFPLRPLTRDEHGRVQAEPIRISGHALPIEIVCDRATRHHHRTVVTAPHWEPRSRTT